MKNIRISNYTRFRKRVFVPSMFVYFAFCAYVGVFANIFYYGKPVTGIIFILLVFGAVGIYEWDAKQGKKNNK